MIDLSFLQSEFDEGSIPAFPCPRCATSTYLKKNGLVFTISKEAEILFELQGSIEEFGIFSMRLICSSKTCGEGINCIGSFTSRLTDDAGRGQYVACILKPRYFYPPINIFPFPENLPESIQKPLLEAFSLFWSNPGATGNALRITLEALMDHLRIPKRGKRTLHSRIEEFQKKYPDMGEKLLALKCLGNSGSHLKGLSSKDVISGFKLFDYALEEIFEKRSKKLTSIAKSMKRRHKKR